MQPCGASRTVFKKNLAVIPEAAPAAIRDLSTLERIKIPDLALRASGMT
jgi:hypothetical protein